MKTAHRFENQLSASVVSHVALGIRNERVIESISRRVVALTGPDMVTVMAAIDYVEKLAASEGNAHPQIQTTHLDSRFGPNGFITSVGCNDVVAHLRAKLPGEDFVYKAIDSPPGSTQVNCIIPIHYLVYSFDVCHHRLSKGWTRITHSHLRFV